MAHASALCVVLASSPARWVGWLELLLLALVLVASVGYLRERRRWNQINHTLEEQVAHRTRELERLNAELKDRTLRDELTGLRNRRFLEGVMHHDLARIQRDCQDYGSAPFSLVFCLVDLDHFKEVNDSLGHHVGDRVLVEMAQLLDEVYRESDYLVRWGGDEFLVVVRYVRSTEAPILAERMRRRVHEHAFDLGESRRRGEVTSSIGYVVHPLVPPAAEAMTIDQILQLADFCLYAAKRSGRNGWVGLSGTDGVAGWPVEDVVRDPATFVTGGQLQLSSSFESVDLGVEHGHSLRPT
jgi:diguanylate cyclase (GGDEF)-like protein